MKNYINAFVLSLVLSWCLACGPRASEAQATLPVPRIVLLMCIDTLRADHLGCYGYSARDTSPTIDALAAQGLFFSDASSCAGWTKPAVPSFMTGHYPLQHGVYEGSARGVAGASTDILPAEARTIAEAFAEAGYATAAFVHNAQLRKGNGFEQGFEIYDDRPGHAGELVDRALEWLVAQRQRDAQRPLFLYLHVLDTHWPYPAPEQAALRFAADETQRERMRGLRGSASRELREQLDNGTLALDEAMRADLLGLYDGAIRFVDDQLARLLARLEERGLRNSLLLALVSDHGEEFGEHGRVGHGHSLSEELLRVPFLLAGPGIGVVRIEQPVSTVDLYPTLLAAAGLQPGASEGVDRLREPELSLPIFAEHKGPNDYRQSLRLGSDKLEHWMQQQPTARRASLEIGRRYDARLTLEEDGGLLIAELDESDEDAGAALEVKGPIERLNADALWLLGMRVELLPAPLLQAAEGVEQARLEAGTWIKVKGKQHAGGLLAEKIKVYAPGTQSALEVRGDLEQVEGNPGQAWFKIRLSGLWLAGDSSSDLDLPARLPRLEHEQMLDWVRERNSGDEPRAFVLERQRIDLNGDGVAGPRSLELEGELCLLTRQLLSRRLLGESARLSLDQAALDALSDIGYVK